MSYIVYTGNDCHDCDLVVEGLKANNIDFRVIQIDQEQVETPVGIFVRPALFKDERLIAYGADILLHFGIPVPDRSK
ncbi:MAG: glutaredoxin domain-containing protein [Salibacteraceae bacterium]